MKKPKILVVGSMVMDQTASTEVFPRQGQTVLGKKFSKAPGGKGSNQAVQAARLGADVTMFGKVGRDSNGDELLESQKAAGIHTEYVLRDDENATAVAIIILEEVPGKATANRIIVVSGSNMAITREDVAFLKDEIKNYDLVMLQLEIPMEINELVAEYAYEAGVPVMLNSAPSAPLSDEFLAHLSYISPNEHEARDITGIEIEHTDEYLDEEAVKKALQALRDRGIRNALITLGSAGAAILNDEEGYVIKDSIKGINVIDPTAAGDSFVGAFCTGVACGWSMDEILTFSNYTAAITVSRLGAQPSLPTLDEVEAFMKERGAAVPDLRGLR